MNAVIYNSLYRNRIWNIHDEQNITNILIHTLLEENLTIETIFFSSLLFHLNNNEKPLFPNKKQIFHSLLNFSPNMKKTKIILFYKIIWKHLFLNQIQKETLLLLFSKMQRTYYGFSLLAQLYKKKYATLVVNQDLFLNILDPTNKKTCILLIYKSIYYFSLTDIWKLLEKGWTNHDHFQLELYTAKNPYTNIAFSKTELYHFYFHFKKVGHKIPLLFEFMFLEHFDLNAYEIKHEHYIFKHIIRKFVFNKVSTENNRHLYSYITEMLEDNTYTNKWEIHPDFPRDKLIDIMRNYVYLYYLITYGKLTSHQYTFICSFLYNSLYLFWKFNPLFGQKKIYSVVNTNRTITNQVSFFDKHLSIKTIHL
jgi:hypothetical protein